VILKVYVCDNLFKINNIVKKIINKKSLMLKLLLISLMKFLSNGIYNKIKNEAVKKVSIMIFLISHLVYDIYFIVITHIAVIKLHNIDK
tara:strand:- start:6656 stop:6922 length:267 start_codon:yes stop_codon:yes gene_type:complete